MSEHLSVSTVRFEAHAFNQAKLLHVWLRPKHLYTTTMNNMKHESANEAKEVCQEFRIVVSEDP